MDVEVSKYGAKGGEKKGALQQSKMNFKPSRFGSHKTGARPVMVKMDVGEVKNGKGKK